VCDDATVTQRDESVGATAWQVPWFALSDVRWWRVGPFGGFAATVAGVRYRWWGRGGVPAGVRARGTVLRPSRGVAILIAAVTIASVVSLTMRTTPSTNAHVRHASSLVLRGSELPREFHAARHSVFGSWVSPASAGLVGPVSTTTSASSRYFERCAGLRPSNDRVFGDAAAPAVAAAFSGEFVSTATQLRVGASAEVVASAAAVTADEGFFGANANARCFAQTVAAGILGRLRDAPRDNSGWTAVGGEGAPFGITVSGPAGNGHTITVLFATRGRDEVLLFGWVPTSRVVASTFEWQRAAAVETRRLNGLPANSPGD